MNKGSTNGKRPINNQNKKAGDVKQPESISPNINYVFNVEYLKIWEYFKSLEYKKASEKKGGNSSKNKTGEMKNVLADKNRSLKHLNKKIFQHKYRVKDAFRPSSYIDTPQKRVFEMKALYPGVLIGIGYAHDISEKKAIKCGFSFDYVTGLPYLPGSSLKGLLRSCFPETSVKGVEGLQAIEKGKLQYIRSLLECVTNIRCDDLSDDTVYEIVEKLKDNIFTYGDVFFDVFPVITQGTELLDEEVITPIKNNISNPINLVKVRPGAVFEFCFLLREFSTKVKDKAEKEYTVRVTEEEKIKLFRTIVTDMGIGAKTNVGFGKMQGI